MVRRTPCGSAHATVSMWSSEDSLWEVVLTFYHVASRDPSHQVWQQAPLIH